MWHAWYSSEAARMYGAALYQSEGGPIMVTAVYRDRAEGESRYHFRDKQYAGVVTRCLEPAPDDGESFWRMII